MGVGIAKELLTEGLCMELIHDLDREAKIVNGWYVSERQCELIGEGNRSACWKFLIDNLKRLRLSAKSYFKHGLMNHLPFLSLLDEDELVNQFYLDMLRGFIHLNIDHISAFVYCSFKYAGCGGFGDDLGAVEFKRGKLVFSIGGSL